MLKLTQQDGSSVYVSPVHISSLYQLSGGRTEVLFAGGSYLVKETPDQIMAMPAMAYFLNPAMVVKL
jgi:hypothetical protein